MWNPESPVNKNGGWAANEKEYKKIIRKTLTTPKYLWLQIFKNMQASARQLIQIGVGDQAQSFPEGSNPYNAVKNRYNHDTKEYLAALQNSSGLKTETYNELIVLFAVISCLSTIFIMVRKQQEQLPRNPEWQNLFMIVIAFIVVNAFVTGTFATVIDRLQARVFWVLPFICLLYVLNYWMEKRTIFAQRTEP
jgi:hypothetical protein